MTKCILKQWKRVYYIINAIGAIDDSFEIKWSQTVSIQYIKTVNDYLTYKVMAVLFGVTKKLEK